MTRLIWQPDWWLARYDALFLFAVGVQVAFLALGLESRAEARVILIYHLTGTLMELFKTEMGSWSYPGEAVIRIGEVPLFSGFMYAAVGSYIARVIRIFDMQIAHAPPLWAIGLLGTAVYVNFFTHHFIWDARWLLIGASAVLFWRTRIWFTTDRMPRWMPLLAASVLTTSAMYIAETVGTLTNTWRYAGQGDWEPVPLGKLSSWYLLLYLSLFLVLLVFRDALHRGPAPARVQSAEPGLYGSAARNAGAGKQMGKAG